MYVSHVAQVTGQVSLLGLIVREQGRILVNTFLLYIKCNNGLCAYLQYKSLSIIHYTRIHLLHVPLGHKGWVTSNKTFMYVWSPQVQ